MSPDELRDHLNALELSRDQAAQFLGVSKRTISRWLDGEEVPGPAQAALRAWRSLNDWNLAWRPDSISVLENDSDQIERQRLHAVRVDEMLRQVKASGGPAHLWKVDTFGSVATFGTSEVSFYKLANGGFSIRSYGRTDRRPDLAEDMPLIRDAAYCIAREFARFGERASALADVAKYISANSHLSARNGAKPLGPKEVARHKARLEGLANDLMVLAEAARDGAASYGSYEAIQKDLHSLGFFPKNSQVAAIARAFS